MDPQERKDKDGKGDEGIERYGSNVVLIEDIGDCTVLAFEYLFE